METICAIATPPGYGAIAIIKVSGSSSIDIVNSVFSGKNLTKEKSHTINYGYIKRQKEYIDEVLVMIMRSPRTYTKEDVVEINCHGGYISAQKVIGLLIEKGCELAVEGEFTKRAFLNGRLTLLEADTINSIINSKTNKAHKIAINNLRNKPSTLIKKIREKLIVIITNILVNIDYPEYLDINQITDEEVKIKIEPIIKELDLLIKDSESAQKINKGLNTSIIGKPNVGKSSLLNLLLGEERAIVTNIPGTTRDLIEESILIDGILLNIIDTAGIRETSDLVESLGIKKSFESIEKADIIVMVTDYNQKLTKEELELIKQTKPDLIIVNKSDLKKQIDLSKIESQNKIIISLTEKESINEIIEKLKKIIKKQNMELKTEFYLSSVASISKLKVVNNKLKSTKIMLKKGIPIDIIETELREAWELLGEIIGEKYNEELLDNLFSKFCVGK